MIMEMSTLDNEYIFVIFEMNPKTGFYNPIGVSIDLNFIHEFLDTTSKTILVEIFEAFDLIKPPIKSVSSWAELKKFIEEN